MNTLRDKVVEIVGDWDSDYDGDGGPNRYDIADRILAIPEIAEALAAMDDEGPTYLSPEERLDVQKRLNEQMRAALSQVADKAKP